MNRILIGKDVVINAPAEVTQEQVLAEMAAVPIKRCDEQWPHFCQKCVDRTTSLVGSSACNVANEMVSGRFKLGLEKLRAECTEAYYELVGSLGALERLGRQQGYQSVVAAVVAPPMPKSTGGGGDNGNKK